MSKLPHREVKSLAQGHTVWEQSDQVLNPRDSDPMNLFFITTVALCPSHTSIASLVHPKSYSVHVFVSLFQNIHLRGSCPFPECRGGPMHSEESPWPVTLAFTFPFTLPLSNRSCRPFPSNPAWSLFQGLVLILPLLIM